MSATTRAHALGAGGTGSQEHHPCAALRRRPISQCLRLQGETTSSSGLDLNPGGEGHNEARRAADGGNGAGGTMPSPVQRASFGGGGACRRLSPPKERQRRSRKRHSFLSRTRLRGQIEPWIFFCEIAGGKVTVPRLTGGLHELAFPPCTFHIVHGSLRVRAAIRPKALAAGQAPTR